MFRHISWALALVMVFSTACVTDLADGYRATATVTANDGTSPLANFTASSYEAIFHLYDGMNVARTYTSTGTGSASSAIVTNGAGQFTLDKSDVGLYTIRTEYECYDTCVAWDYDCYYDEWDTYVCHDYCSWYVTDCYDRDYAVGVDMGSVSSVSTFLNYSVGSSSVRTAGTPISNSRDSDSNTWIRQERFVTPISNASQPGDGSQPTLHSLPQPKRTECADQSELSEEQMTKLRELRAYLGVESSEVVGRQ